jgi:hypothetical protein
MNGIPRCARNDSTILLYGRGGKCCGGISTGSMTSRRVVIPSVARNPFPKIELISASVYLVAGKLLNDFVGAGFAILASTVLMLIFTILLIIS